MNKSTFVQPVRQNVAIGARIRSHRQSRGLSIEHVAQAVGVTKSFLSRFERDNVSASIATLLKLCDAIGIKPGVLFDAPEANYVPSGEGQPINLGGEGMFEFAISGGQNAHFLALLSVIEAGGGSGSEPYSLNAATDMVHVKSGVLEMTVGEERYRLQAGDTLTFQPSIPHTWVNPQTDELTVAVWVIAPPP